MAKKSRLGGASYVEQPGVVVTDAAGVHWDLDPEVTEPVGSGFVVDGEQVTDGEKEVPSSPGSNSSGSTETPQPKRPTAKR